jgi:hypothetical protein
MAFCWGVTGDSKPDDAPETSSASQSSSVLGLIAEVVSSSRECRGLTKTWKMSKDYAAIVSIKQHEQNAVTRMGMYVESPPDPSVQL